MRLNASICAACKFAGASATGSGRREQPSKTAPREIESAKLAARATMRTAGAVAAGRAINLRVPWVNR